MELVKFSIAGLCILLFATLGIASERLTQEQQETIRKAADGLTRSHQSRDHEAVVTLLYPEMVKAGGGKERMVAALKAEDAKNDAAGVALESFDLKVGDELHRGSQFKLTFLKSEMLLSMGKVRMQSESYWVAFSKLHEERWYFLDGTRLTQQQFRSVFRGFPDSLKLPVVQKKPA